MIDKISNPAAAAKLYANQAKGIEAPGLGAPEKQSFGDIMKTKAMDAVQTLRAGEAASARAVTGEATLPEVVGAITASELTLQTVVSIRDRLVTAYQEVMRMPV